MRIRAGALFVLATVAMNPVRAADPPVATPLPKLESVVTADSRISVAFLELVPAAIQKSMKAALDEECEALREDPLKTDDGKPIDVSWICGGKSLHFLREVRLDGGRNDGGYVCDSSHFEDAKFLPPDYAGWKRCVWISYDSGSETHDVDLATQLADAAK